MSSRLFLKRCKRKLRFRRIIPRLDSRSSSQLYSPLKPGSKQIRLLTIQPGADDDLVYCSLTIHNLARKWPLHYETISYCWGDASHEDDVHVNGIRSSFPASAVAALRCLRQPTHKRRVWIDAICINQSDVDEKGDQVQMMADIYQSGACNLIYLGEVDIAEQVGDVIRLLREIPEEYRKNPTIKSFQYDKNNINQDYNAAKLTQLLSNPWFQHRIYVDRGLYEATKVLVDPLFSMELADARQGGFTAAAHLNTVRYRHCKLDVDHVYGILAILPRFQAESRARLQADYSKTAYQVYLETAWYLVGQQGDLRYLCFLGRHDTTKGFFGLPSWVPLLKQDFDEAEGQSEKGIFLDSFDPSKGHRCPILDNYARAQRHATEVVNRDRRTLSVTAMVIGSVSRLSQPYSDASEFDIWLTGIESWLHEALWGQDKVFDLDRDTEVMLAATLCVYFTGRDRSSPTTFEMTPPETQWKRYRSYKRYKQRNAALPVTLHEARESDDPDALLAYTFKDYASIWCRNRRLFLTADCKLGIGPSWTPEGGILSVLYTLFRIAILQPAAEGQFFYRGLTHVHGVMQGEVFEQPEKYQERVITLC